MTSRSIQVKLLVFALVTVVATGYVGFRYLNLGDLLLATRYTVYLELAETGGVFPGAEVTYRGVPVGRIDRFDLRPGSVRAALRLERAHRIPADLTAVVANRSAIGEQYLDLRPRSTTGPYLGEGSIVPAARARLPVSTASLLTNTDRLATSLPAAELNSLVRELHTGLAGAGPDLARLVDAGNDLVERADHDLVPTTALIEDSRTVLETQRDQRRALAEFSAHLASLTGELRRDDRAIRTTLHGGARAGAAIGALAHRVDGALPVLLTNLTSLGQVTQARVPGIRQALVMYPYFLAAAFTVLPGDGTIHAGVSPNLYAPPPCSRGFGRVRAPDPAQLTPVPFPAAGRHCTQPPGVSGVRGVNAAIRASKAAARTAAKPLAKPVVNGPTAPVTHRSPVATPVVDTAVGPGAVQYVIASTGGQQGAMGDQSWQWLLVDPLTGPLVGPSTPSGPR